MDMMFSRVHNSLNLRRQVCAFEMELLEAAVLLLAAVRSPFWAGQMRMDAFLRSYDLETIIKEDLTRLENIY